LATPISGGRVRALRCGYRRKTYARFIN
jgi:hypothetical protein